MCLCKQDSLKSCCRRQLCAPPSTASLRCSTLTVMELLDLAVLHMAARWYHFGLVLQGSPPGGHQGHREGEVVAGCSEMLKCWLRGEWAEREEWSWVTVLGAVQRCLRQESVWRTASHCRQHSHEYPMWSPQQEEVQGMDKQDP